MYAAENWIEAKDLESAVIRLEQTFDALALDTLLHINRIHNHTYDQLEMRYSAACEKCAEYLRGQVCVEELMICLIELDLEEYVEYVQKFVK